MWASHKLLLQNLDLRREGPPGNSGTTGQQRDDDVGGGGRAAARLSPWMGLRGSKVTSASQSVDKINTIILGEH